MRWLKINGTYADIDQQTAIGIDIQGLDLKEPGKQKLNASNSFTIPLTTSNCAIFGIIGGVQSNYSGLYSENTCEYGIDNDTFISGDKCKVDLVSDRISLTITDSLSLFDKLKEIKGDAMFQMVHAYMSANKSVYDYPTETFEDTRTLQEITEAYANTTSGMHLAMAYGPLYEKQFENLPGTVIDDGPPYYTYLESELGGIKLAYPRITEDNNGTKIVDTVSPPSVCPHFFIYAHTFLLSIESMFGVSLGVNDAVNGNAWRDANFRKMLILMPGLMLTSEDTAHRDLGYKWSVVPINLDGSYSYFDPLSNVRIDSYSAYDLLMSMVKIMSAVVDKQESGYLFRRIDELEQYGNILDWSGKIDADAKRPMKPYLPNYAQKNYIKYDKVEEGAGELAGAKTVVCTNFNLPKEVELFKVKGYVPLFGNFKGYISPVLSKSNAIVNPVFMFVTGKHLRQTLIKTYCAAPYNRDQFQALTYLDNISVYSMDGEYKFLDKVNDSPRFYTAELWLTNNDIRALDNFTMVYVRELNGMFYVNKISGYNPDKSNSATSVELIRISDRTPLPPADLPYYTDGQGNIFTDGQGNYFY